MRIIQYMLAGLLLAATAGRAPAMQHEATAPPDDAAQPAAVHETAAPEAEHGGHGGHNEGPRPALLTFDPGVALWTIIVFVALLILLRTLAWKRLLGALQQREAFIQNSIDEARDQRVEAEKLVADYRAQLEKARAEATAIVEESRRDAEEVRRRLQEEAHKDAEELVARARREIKLAKDTAVKELYDRTADLAVQVATGVIGKELSDADHRRLIDESLAELRAVDKGSLN
ncbi:MAG: F0F1 ATP synthase subunit B [Phycisphaerae bacterium]|jgi:F-type H+-transporting ATPase subunit b